MAMVGVVVTAEVRGLQLEADLNPEFYGVWRKPIGECEYFSTGPFHITCCREFRTACLQRSYPRERAFMRSHSFYLILLSLWFFFLRRIRGWRSRRRRQWRWRWRQSRRRLDVSQVCGLKAPDRGTGALFLCTRRQIEARYTSDVCKLCL